jgi:hypothetical protein
MRPLPRLTAMLAALSFVPLAGVPSASADDDDDWNPLYVGQGSHVGLGTGLGLNFGDGTDAFGLSPYVSARVKVAADWGVLVDVPFLYGSLSQGGASETRFDVGNITLAGEYRIDEMASSFSRVRFGVALPVMQGETDDIAGAIMQGVNVALASGAAGLFNVWRHVPDAFSVFGEFIAEGHVDEAYIGVSGGLGVLVPTADGGDVELVMQLAARLGYGIDIIGFVGLGMVIVPTETGIGISQGGGDAFQSGLQLGGIFKLGRARLDATLQVNFDAPAGFSFSDEGIFGVHLGLNVPF